MTMGMHDELYCEAELPDADVPAGAMFETKAFPCPFLYRYTISKAGRLIDAHGRDLACEGYLEFYYYLDRSVESQIGGVSSPLLPWTAGKHRSRKGRTGSGRRTGHLRTGQIGRAHG